jgi:hypothetical protein
MTDIVPSTMADVATGERIWMDKPQPVVVSIADKGLRRETRTVGIVGAGDDIV